MSLKKTILAAVVALAMPFAASAATVVTQNGDVTFDTTTLEGVIKLPGAIEFDIRFDASDIDKAGILKFDVINTSSYTIKVDVFSYTINQGGTNYGFMNGVDLWIGGTLEASFGEGQSGLDLLTGTLAGNDTTSFSFDYGKVYAQSGVYPNIDFNIVATVVPLPAAGLLLLGAIGGLGLMRRRAS